MAKLTLGILATSALLGLGGIASAQQTGTEPLNTTTQGQPMQQQGTSGAASDQLHNNQNATQQSTGSYAPNLEKNAPNAGTK